VILHGWQNKKSTSPKFSTICRIDKKIEIMSPEAGTDWLRKLSGIFLCGSNQVILTQFHLLKRHKYFAQPKNFFCMTKKYFCMTKKSLFQ
jgi:hypothetical protein